jgi:hypothetical protein
VFHIALLDKQKLKFFHTMGTSIKISSNTFAAFFHAPDPTPIEQTETMGVHGLTTFLSAEECGEKQRWPTTGHPTLTLGGGGSTAPNPASNVNPCAATGETEGGGAGSGDGEGIASALGEVRLSYTSSSVISEHAGLRQDSTASVISDGEGLATPIVDFKDFRPRFVIDSQGAHLNPPPPTKCSFASSQRMDTPHTRARAGIHHYSCSQTIPKLHNGNTIHQFVVQAGGGS